MGGTQCVVSALSQRAAWPRCTTAMVESCCGWRQEHTMTAFWRSKVKGPSDFHIWVRIHTFVAAGQLPRRDNRLFLYETQQTRTCPLLLRTSDVFFDLMCWHRLPREGWDFSSAATKISRGRSLICLWNVADRKGRSWSQENRGLDTGGAEFERTRNEH